MTWDEVARRAASVPRGARLRFPAAELPEPSTAGFVRSLGLPYGQAEDWRRPEPGGASLHAQRFAGFWDVHMDSADPARDPAGHLLNDVVSKGDLPFALLLIAGLLLIPKILE